MRKSAELDFASAGDVAGHSANHRCLARSWLLAAILCAGALAACASPTPPGHSAPVAVTVPAQPDFWAEVPHAEVVLQANAVQPAGEPVLLFIRITNRDTAPYPYWNSIGWNGGPEHYPDPRFMPVLVTDATGHSLEAHFANRPAAALSGSGRFFKIEPGATKTIPAVLEPGPPEVPFNIVGEPPPPLPATFPAGKYTLQCGPSQPVVITLRPDAALAQKQAEDILSQIHKNDQFAGFIIGEYPLAAVSGPLLRDLGGDDPKVAESSAILLQRYAALTPADSPILAAAVNKQLSAEPPMQAPAWLSVAPGVAAKIGTDEMLATVFSLTDPQLPEGIRYAAVAALGDFPADKVQPELKAFLRDSNERVRTTAARVLAHSRDPDALEFFLAALATGHETSFGEACDTLAEFYADDPRVEPALKMAATAKDEGLRNSAGIALQILNEERSWRAARPKPAASL